MRPNADLYHKQQIADHFNMAANHYEQHARLQKITGEALINYFIQKKIPCDIIADIGSGTSYCTKILTTHFPSTHFIATDIAPQMLKNTDTTSYNISKVNADFDNLPINNNAVDAIFSNMALQWSMTLSSTLIELNRVLKKNGLLAFAIPGQNTLHELRTSWQAVDSAPHINHFYSEQNIKNALALTGFNNIMIEKKIISFSYPDIFSLLRTIKATGANYVIQRINRGLIKTDFQKLANAYEAFRHPESQTLPASYEILYVTANKKGN